MVRNRNLFLADVLVENLLDVVPGFFFVGHTDGVGKIFTEELVLHTVFLSSEFGQFKCFLVE